MDNRVIVFPRSSIEKLWRVSGEKGHALTGALIGLPAGAIAGLAFSALTCGESFSELCTFVGLLAGSGLGVITGAIIGSSIKSVSWQKVDVSKINLSLGVIHGRTAGLKISWAF